LNFLQHTAIPHIRRQLEDTRAILFTGAGFSMAAKNLSGTRLPTSSELSQALWRVAFPSDPYDPDSLLKDVYAAAVDMRPNDVVDTLNEYLTVAPESLEDWMASYFIQPWHRVYTLNVDTLADAVNHAHDLPRKLLSTSAITGSPTTPPGSAPHLQVIHLNGTLDDAPHNITFSEFQYAQRQSSPDPTYQVLASDLLSRPLVFVGTNLDEPPLWQSIEQRLKKGQPRGLRELRPRSYLVTPHLDQARASRLESFNIFWLKMTARDFAEQVLARLEDATAIGLRKLSVTAGVRVQKPRLELVSDLATSPGLDSDFLLGTQPIWADVQSGRAIERRCDEDFFAHAKEKLESNDRRGVLIVTGTAGSGKTTSLMRLALRLSAAGRYDVGWIDNDSDLSPRAILSAMKNRHAPEVLAIDRAESFGSSLSNLLRDLGRLESNPLIVISMRSGRIDSVLNSYTLRNTKQHELTVPHLTNSDIDSLIGVLERENRLGVLKGLPRDEQRERFRRTARRQLLVAMISATSGKKFEDKIEHEYKELPADAQVLYATVCLSTQFGFPLTKHQIIRSVKGASNTDLNTIQRLVGRHILAELPPKSGRLQPRHRMIGDHLVELLRIEGSLEKIVRGLGRFSTTLDINDLNRQRSRRLRRGVLNHDFLSRTLGHAQSSAFYRELEDALRDDYQYWLQRGSLEVELGDLDLAENFLGQAKALDPGNPHIENEWAYLRFSQALGDPNTGHAEEMAESAMKMLTRLMRRPNGSPHPFHVFGSQGLAWSRRGIRQSRKKGPFLRHLVAEVEKGVMRFPNERELRTLLSDLKREHLELAVPTRRKTP